MSAKPVRGITVTRWIRRALAVILAWNLGMGIYDLTTGHLFGLISFACVLGLAAAMAYQTKVIHRIERANRPRPDYSAIAAMEREVYGETFGHEGGERHDAATAGTCRKCGKAPARHPGYLCSICYEGWISQVIQSNAKRPGRKRPVRYVKPPRSAFEDDRRAMQALGEARRTARARSGETLSQRWDGRTTHPDTTEPATAEQYAAWLRGYVKRGGKPTHFYDHPFPKDRFRYASSAVTVDSDYEYGSSLRHIIVARNVTTERTNPAGPFGGWAHTKLYFMHGYRTNDSIVPVYSDPEFDAFR